jgi:hypothetical protein
VVNGLVIISFEQRSEDEKQSDEASHVGGHGMLHQ